MNRESTKFNPDAIARVTLFGLPLDLVSSKYQVINRFRTGNVLLTYLNPYAYAVARKTPAYAENLDNFDLVVCDGIGIQKAVKNVFNFHTPILTPDMYGIGQDYLALASGSQLSLCLVGGKPNVAKAAGERILDDYPGVAQVDGYEGFGKSPDLAREHILNTNPDMVLVGMGMGPQERFVHSLRESGWRGIGICVGGFFDKLADPSVDYPEWSKRFGMRFAGRLAREPRRMIKRYFWDYRIFMWRYVLASLRIGYTTK